MSQVCLEHAHVLLSSDGGKISSGNDANGRFQEVRTLSIEVTTDSYIVVGDKITIYLPKSFVVRVEEKER